MWGFMTPTESSFEEQFQQLQQLQSSGRWDEAAQLAQGLLQSNPQDTRLLNELGHLALARGRLPEALDHLGRSLRLSRDQFQPLCDIGTLFGLSGRLELALEAFDHALVLEPDNAPAHYNRGLVLERLNQPGEALTAYDRALDLNPALSPAHTNRGNLLKNLNRLEEALSCYDRVLKLDDSNADAHNNRATVLVELGRTEEALKSFDQAIAMSPRFAMAYKNKAQLLLLLGQFEQGWPLYEWRWKADLRGEYRNFPKPVWFSRDSLKGRTILIQSEQGLGDILQFCRYVPMLKDKAAQVLFEVPKPLMTLLKTLPGGAIFIEKGQPLPHFDTYAPLMTLPLSFKTTLKTIPNSAPYLFTDSAKKAAWQKRLGSKSKPRIGLAWSGREHYIHDSKRSLALELLKPLMELSLEFHSLQKDYRPKDEALLSNLSIKDHRMELEDFSDTAALIEEMDLVISADTSVAHLAGALGKKVWIMLPSIPNCRWLLDRSDSPWYPTAKLFRQPKAGDWPDVVRQLVLELGSNEWMNVGSENRPV